jgi:hypothetical protein
MDLSQYKDYVIQTSSEVYPKYIQDFILRQLKSLNIVVDNSSPSVLNDALDISSFAEEEKLTRSLQARDQAIKYIEQWEFQKPYKYAAVFAYDDFDTNIIGKSVQEGEIIQFSNSTELYDELSVDQENIQGEAVLGRPTTLETDSQVFLKFNIRYQAVRPSTGQTTKLKYPLLVVIYKDIKVVEVRLDRIPYYYRDSDLFYKNKINLVLRWLKDNLNITCSNIDWWPAIDYILENKQDEVAIHSQLMSLRTGGKATLEVGHNNNYILPLIGELKELIKEHEYEFNQCPKIKELLENFILDTEQTSDLPWISLCWKNPVKAKKIVVKFHHNYFGEDYTVLQYLGILREMERMSYVTRYLIANNNLD